MNSQQALDNIKYFLDEHCSDEEVWESVKCLEELVDKSISTKPNYEGDGYSNGQLIYDTWTCPSCRKTYEVDCGY